VLVPVLTAFTVRSAKVTDKGALAHETTAVVEPCVESLAGALHAPRPRHITASSAGAVLEFVVTSIKMLVTTQTLRTPFTAHAAIRVQISGVKRDQAAGDHERGSIRCSHDPVLEGDRHAVPINSADRAVDA
jgi:hypothetical protein